MDQGVKLAAACGVLLFGVVVALVIPRDSALEDQPPSNVNGPMTGRGHVAPPLSSGPVSQWPTTSANAEPPTNPHRITVPQPSEMRPLDPGGLPPDLAPHYPREGYLPPARRDLTSRWGTSISLNPPKAAQRQRIHTIVDGDTLERLAEQYLGSADRSQEIFDANRDVLSSPRLLPIGKKLRIPPCSGSERYATDVRERRPMIPIGN